MLSSLKLLMTQKSSSHVEDLVELSLAQLANLTVSPGLQGAEAILRSILSSLAPHRRYKDITLILARRAVNATVQISTLIEATKEAPQWLRHVERLAEVLHQIRLFIQTETQGRALHRALLGKVRYRALERRLTSVLDDAERCNIELRAGSSKMSGEIPAKADSIRAAQSQTSSSSLMNNSDVIRSNEMFSDAHNLVFTGCNYYNGQISIQHVSGQASIQGIVPGIPVVAFEDISISQEIYKHQRYRLHSATDISTGKVRVAKVYQGPRAKERAQEAASFHKKVLHPTFSHIVGVSPLNCEVSFLVFNGGLEGSLEVSIAKALDKDLKKSLILGLQAVIGLSSGLDYIRDVDYPFVNARSEHFHAFLNFEGAVVVSFDPDISYEHQSDVIHNSHDEQSSLSQVDLPLLIFHELCKQTFDAACQAHYEQRQVERTYALDTEDFTSFIDDSDPASPARKVEAAGHRRELVWKPEKEKNSSLEEIYLKFKAFLNDNLISSEPLLHHRRGRCTGGIAHRCPGYNRTEITLTPSITHSAIVSHSTPLPQEICLVCHQVVNNVETFNCICGREDDESTPTIQCLKCSIWRHRYCVVGFESTARSFTCPDCKRKRTATACMNCRARKLKCRPPDSADGDPCERCVKEGVTCQYRPVDSSPVWNNRTPNYPDQDSPVNLYSVQSYFPPNQQSAPTANPQYYPVQPPTSGGHIPNHRIVNAAAHPPFQAKSFYPTQQYHPSPYPAQYSVLSQSDMDSSNSRSTRERRRTAMACMNCRIRKLKCRPPADGDPCERCIKERVTCRYRPHTPIIKIRLCLNYVIKV